MCQARGESAAHSHTHAAASPPRRLGILSNRIGSGRTAGLPAPSVPGVGKREARAERSGAERGAAGAARGRCRPPGAPRAGAGLPDPGARFRLLMSERSGHGSWCPCAGARASQPARPRRPFFQDAQLRARPGVSKRARPEEEGASDGRKRGCRPQTPGGRRHCGGRSKRSLMSPCSPFRPGPRSASLPFMISCRGPQRRLALG